MKVSNFLTGFLFFSLLLSSCKNGKNQHIDVLPTLELGEEVHPQVKEAMNAWQEGKCDQFRSYFVENPVMKDGKNTGDFNNYYANGCGKEGFIRIDKVSPDGLTIQGPYRTLNWGEIPTYLHFEINQNGKFTLLEIGEYKE